jgi:maltose alpha-D-glucosyltransferase/alpha-amylase
MNIRQDPTLENAKAAPEMNDSLWYKDAVIYQLHVKSFFDSNNDGIGDFPGLISKLDYLADLGVTAIWLLPFYPSPRRDDGYDISDYRNVHPEYGTLDDVRRFIALAHERKMRVITELVLNHTSDQHPWFQRARKAQPGSPERNFYVWSDDDKRYSGTRIIFLDTEKSNWTWDEEVKAYYWHRFYSHQPDLNFDNPAVLEESLSIMRFWLDMGVDGLRLDAVPYLVERDGTNNENLPETHAILKRIRAEVDASYPGRMLLAEANQWPEDVQAYFGEENECHMLFHFPLMPRMYMAIAQEDRFPIMDIMRQTPDAPPSCQWATFLRNHDELTLEMVTDKERDYLWKTYASDRRARLNLGIRRRLAPLLERDFRRIELMHSLLLTIMGTPILYYGDELGMGDNIHLGDRDGVRTPMQWSPDRNGGFSRADPAQLILPPIMDSVYGYEAVNVEAQWRNPYSPLNWVRRMLSVRGRWKAFGRGSIRFLRPQNRKVLAYLREFEDETILCVANVSRTAQAVELDLGEFAGRTPVELSGEVPFPKIGQLTYLLTLPPFGFYWFSLSADASPPVWSTATSDNLAEYHTFIIRDGIGDVLSSGQRRVLEKEVLPPYLLQRRWYQGKSGGLSSVLIVDEHRFSNDLMFLVVEANGERYSLPAAIAWDEEPPAPFEAALALARARRGPHLGLLTDGFANPRFARTIMSGLADGCGQGVLACAKGAAFAKMPADAKIEWLAPEQSNSTLVIDRTAVLKLFRRLVDGLHPEAEMIRELTDRGFGGIASLMGEVRYKNSTAAIVQRYVENQGDGFKWSLEQIGHWVDEKTVSGANIDTDLVAYRAFIKTAGRRLGEMHAVLAQPSSNPAFTPETAGDKTIQTWRDQFMGQINQALALRSLGDSAALFAAADKAFDLARKFPLTRIHGDMHLGQILVAADDAIIVDFEGEPAKSLEQRRAKNSPLRDVAGMLRSFDYVAGMVARRESLATNDRARGQELLNAYREMTRKSFLQGYAGGRGQTLKPNEEQLLTIFALEKAAYEVVYEANNRPDWIDIPVEGFQALAARL